MRLRLVLVFVGITVAVLAAHDIPLASHLRQVERDRLVTGLERDAFIIGGRAEDVLDRGVAAGDPALQQMVDAYRRVDGARVIITDHAGIAMVISDEEAAAGSNYSTRPEIASALTGAAVNGQRVSKTLGFDLLYVAVPVLSGSDVVGAVRLTYPAGVVADRVASRVRGLLLVAVISVVTAAVAAIILASTVVRPIRRLRAATEQLAAGDLAVRASAADGPVEVRGLATSFNAMAERLSTLVGAQRAFAGDASHQLRTPLTALRLRLERAVDLIDADPAGARERIEAAGEETERLQHLVDGLLALARAEGASSARVTVDLAEVLRDRVAVWQPLAEEHGIELRLDAPDRLVIVAGPGAAEQVVDNYVDNALGAAANGTVIELTAHSGAANGAGAAMATLHVLDRGRGMTHEQLARAFDRFWRGAEATPGGSGLGLAIVDQLVRASGGVASLRARPGGGVDASATFPLAPR